MKISSVSTSVQVEVDKCSQLGSYFIINDNIVLKLIAEIWQCSNNAERKSDGARNSGIQRIRRALNKLIWNGKRNAKWYIYYPNCQL